MNRSKNITDASDIIVKILCIFLKKWIFCITRAKKAKIKAEAAEVRAFAVAIYQIKGVQPC